MSNSTNEMAVLNIVKNGVSSSYECIDQQARNDIAAVTENSKAISFTNGLAANTTGQTVSIGLDMTNATAGKYLKTDTNNQVTWGELNTEEVSRVHILSKTTDFTLSEFNEIWDWLGNGHVVGVYRRMQFALIDMDCLYLARQRYTNTYGRTIAFVFDKINTDWDNNDNSALVAYLGMLVWNTNYSKNSISFIERTMIPDPTNNQNKFLFCNGSGGFSYVPAFRVTASSDSSFSAVSGTSNILNVNSSRGYLGAGTDLHKYLMLDESNVTGASDDGKLVTLDYNNGNFKLGLSSVNSVPPSTTADEGKILSVNSQGSPGWTALERDTFGSLTDDEGDEIQDEEGNSIGDENSVELWASFNGTGFGAERAVADVDGNPLNLTISNDQVIAIGGKSILPTLRQAEATENTTINVVNNRVTWVSNITYSTMTFNVAVPSGESANFAVELLNQHACTVSVTVNGVQVPKASAALNELEAGKTYQLTCVGYGWTCVEVDVPSYTVTIDSKTYGATRLGNHLWTTENLDYLFTGCTLDETAENKPMAWSNSADPTYKGKYGLVYNYKAILYLAEHADELLPSGWRLPTLDDWRQLGATIGWDPTQSGQMVTGDKANAFRNTEWYLYNDTTRQDDIPGTNLYGLNVLPAGTFNSGEFYNIGKTGQFWASDSLDLSAHRLWKASVDSAYGWSYVEASLASELLYTYGVHIRLIKDL